MNLEGRGCRCEFRGEGLGLGVKRLLQEGEGLRWEGPGSA